MNFKFVYKICTKSEWQEVKSKGQLTGSKKDLEDGFIHFSGDDQVAGTLKKFYQNQNDLILLKVDTLKLDHLVWEQASDGTMFPHLYSPLDLSNVVEEFEISLKMMVLTYYQITSKGDTLSETPKEFPYNLAIYAKSIIMDLFFVFLLTLIIKSHQLSVRW